MQIEDGILTTIGRTPLVRLKKVFGEQPVELYAKLEFLNPGGSSKDRPALAMIREGLASGRITEGTVIVESSSGNMAISLAKLCAYLGLRFLCVVDPKTTEQNIRIVKTFGAEIVRVTEPDPETGEYLPVRIRRVRELLLEHPNSFWPNQYANVHNPLAHSSTTMQEIADELDHRVDYLFCGVSTGGTIRGCAEYIREHGMKTTVVAVDAAGSVLFGGAPRKRLLPGLGAAVVPPLFRYELIDRSVQVTDLDSIAGCRQLVRREAILAGGSSGGVIAAVRSMLGELPAGARCVVILPDRGERYLDTVYSDDWVRSHFGDVEHQWGEGV
ncbi:2,3-diaminopropionate biosynthesis protein SbnA [Paenibacillus sp. J31TS4]|uniref:2,3-diaminopropionate biosynthesis protein SbnA n=1 Tax=Paenibacillus sp. J31TS4 TaxID=2807195 RepID=UPI001B04A176|nr:2,3-diaminopropionate biosynthesis protein SbnA [Paenibacillus sp. J31TS4]GIP38564.1 2,3-diaminopropionate biosynthesis protein SbnA [Paenibacillus sp. J31TS4]